MAKSIKLIFLLLIFLPTNALANIFDPPITDLSVEYLGMIFGGSVGNISLGTATESNPFFGSLFQVFNGVILAVATFILSYIGAISIIHTAHEGEVMGKKWSSIWIPLRSASGLLLLAPVPGSGFSLLQVTVMWIILNGVGAADKVWNLVVDNLAQGISAAQQTELDSSSVNTLMSNARSIGPAILKNLVCLKVIQNNVDNNFLQSIGQSLGANIVDDTSSINSGNIFFGVQDPNKLNNKNQAICGKIQISATVTSSDLDPSVTKEQLTTASTIAYQAKKEALTSMITYIKPVADEIVNTIADLQQQNKPIVLPADLTDGLLYPAVSIYQNLLSRLTKQSILVQLGLATSVTNNNIDGLVSSNIDKAKSKGWIIAGSFYFMLSKGSLQGMIGTALQKPTINDVALSNNDLKKTSVDSLDSVFKTYANTLSSATITNLFNNPHTTSSTSIINFMNPWTTMLLLIPPPIGEILMGVVLGIQGAMMLFINGLTNIDGDPLLQHAKVGAALMGVIEALFIAIALGSIIGSLFLALVECLSPGANMMLVAMVTVIMPIMAICAILWTLGATLGIYNPMIPYMIFSMTALSWLMLVVEAIVAAPIVALGLILPAQEELGSLHTALGILAGIFLRPTLMIIGLLMSVKMFSVMLKFISFGFATSIKILQDATLQGSMLSCIPICALYVGFVIALENKCFSLIYQLPDKILRWIGIQPEQTDISAMSEAQKSFESGGKKGLEAVQSTAEGKMKEMQEKAQENQKASKIGGGGDSGGDKTSGPDAVSGDSSGASLKAVGKGPDAVSGGGDSVGKGPTGPILKGGGGAPPPPTVPPIPP